MSFMRMITVEKRVETTDATYGTPIVTWEPLASIGSPPVAVKFQAEVQDLIPSRERDESIKQGVQVARKRTRIRMRWRSDIDSSMRIKVHGASDEVYQIIGGPAEIDGRKRRIELLCEKYTSA